MYCCQKIDYNSHVDIKTQKAWRCLKFLKAAQREADERIVRAPPYPTLSQSHSDLPPMPVPNTPTAPKFDGNPAQISLQNFFDQVETLCRQSNMGDKYITEWALEYIEHAGDRAIMRDIAPEMCDWEGFKLCNLAMFGQVKKYGWRDWRKVLW